jgi:hypothetical protein
LLRLLAEFIGLDSGLDRLFDAGRASPLGFSTARFASLPSKDGGGFAACHFFFAHWVMSLGLFNAIACVRQVRIFEFLEDFIFSQQG